MSAENPHLEAENESHYVARPMLSDPSLQEFPTTFAVDTSDERFPKLRVQTEGGEVTGYYYAGEPDQPDYGAPKGKTIKVGNVEVQEGYRGHGIATDLLRTFSREARERGAVSLSSIVVNPTAMRNRARVFGPEKTTLWEFTPDLIGKEVTLSDAQAAASLERSTARREMREAMGVSTETHAIDQGWDTFIDLTDPEVVRHLNTPLEPWQPAPRIVGKDEQHYPDAWDGKS